MPGMNTVADTNATDSATVALARFNRLPPVAAAERLRRCCANAEWAARMAAGRPYDSLAQLLDAADRHWRALPAEAWLQAFGAHPEIGDMKTAGDSAAAAGAGDGDAVGDSRQEQSGVASASAQTRAALARLNRDYRQRFGFIFIICASGLSADAMLRQLRVRIKNSRAQELANAAEEQRKITRLRLRKLFDGDATVAATVETVTVDSSAATEPAKPATANSTAPAAPKPATTTPTSPPA